MISRHAMLTSVHLFNGVSAVGGGLALLTGLVPTVPSWVNHTGFTDNYFPGVILLAIVGGSSLVAGISMVKHAVGWHLASIVAGIVMVIWILGEIAPIRGFHFLQVVYLLTGLAALGLTPRAVARAHEERTPQDSLR